MLWIKRAVRPIQTGRRSGGGVKKIRLDSGTVYHRRDGGNAIVIVASAAWATSNFSSIISKCAMVPELALALALNSRLLIADNLNQRITKAAGFTPRRAARAQVSSAIDDTADHAHPVYGS